MKYSIVLPVHNGGKYIEQCIASILSQSVSDFELVILENQSSDETVKLISFFADPRIRIIPSSTLLSIEENWSRIKGLTRGEFLTIIGHDDLLTSHYLKIMDDLIDKYPDASLYQTHFNYINEAGEEIAKAKLLPEKLMPSEVIEGFLCGKIDIMGTGFMMRRNDFDRAGGMPSYKNLLFADMELWIELSRFSYMATSGIESFSYRKHPGATTSTSSSLVALMAFDRFILYLERLQKEDEILKQAITSAAPCLLREYVKGISHSVLRTPIALRTSPSVKEIIKKFQRYGNDLALRDFNAQGQFSVRLGRVIDENVIFRSFYHQFRRLFKKPIL